MLRGAAFLGTLVLAGCSTVPEGAPSLVKTVGVDYAKFGACAFDAMDRIWPNQIRLVDLRGTETIRIFMEVTTNGPMGVLTVRQIEVTVKKTGENRSTVAIGTRALTSEEQAWSRIEACAA
ncbi:hypothetical protein [Bosea minatitlanensis]|uniref:Lipoprotein n=1 Tax=Bosea minatitlanensis TaxID=128782 RepID=A0ABW0F2G6_9HYPH|nr:hypothetical protein [Bosea minatitlanensis]MCT4492758.1 hypothetical protein [Bosea minatitlanensis]